jgi:hypothetical protein
MSFRGVSWSEPENPFACQSNTGRKWASNKKV